MLAFFILSHRSAAHVGDLLRYIYSPANHYLLHVDRKAPAALHRLAGGAAAAFANVQLIESQYCSWGGFSLVAVTLNAIRQALTSPGWSHFIILSEQHLPLMPAASIAQALSPGVSDIEMSPLRSMTDAGARDVMNRFAEIYRELPGVGAFALRPRPAAAVENLHHGSQWMILGRALCRTVAETTDPAFWEIFATSLLADETALQTIAAGAEAKGAKISGQNRTWVATPERIGNRDMIFAERHFFAAKNDGRFLFIRKRPDDLPAAVRQVLEAQAAFTAAEFSAILARQATGPAPTKSRFTTQDLVLQLRWELNPFDKNLEIETVEQTPNAPGCYIRLRYPGSHPALRLCVLCEDMVHFKVLLAVQTPFDGDFSPATFFGLRTSVIRARVHDIAYHREIHIENATSGGFVELRDLSDLSPLISALRPCLAQFSRLNRDIAEATASHQAAQEPSYPLARASPVPTSTHIGFNEPSKDGAVP
jgi:hypothetical protein